MSFTLSITGHTSTLSTNFYPALQFDGEYECALLHLSTFNSIPNIESTNNKFHYAKNEVLEIPEGAYELQDISGYIRQNLKMKGITFNLYCNNNTLKTIICCGEEIHFEKDSSLGPLLGFGKKILKANILHESQLPINILSTTVVRVECDIISGSYIDGKPSHIIHEFAPNVPPGYRIIEIPKNIIYFPVNQSNVNTINIRLLDIKNNLINLRGEEVQLYLHIKRR